MSKTGYMWVFFFFGPEANRRKAPWQDAPKTIQTASAKRRTTRIMTSARFDTPSPSRFEWRIKVVVAARA